MKNNDISINAKIYHFGIKMWCNDVCRKLDSTNWIKKNQKCPNVPKSISNKFDTKTILINNYVCYVIKPKKNPLNNPFMYIHGGAYIFQITSTHWNFIKKIINKTNAPCYVPIYPLSNSEYSSCEDGINFLIGVYKKMLETYSPENISIMGDSAGATLSIVLGQQLKLNNLPKPKNIISFSPSLWFSKTEIDEFKDSKIEVLSKKMITYAYKWYVKDKKDEENPIYSPINGDSNDICNTITIFVGGSEGFATQCRKYDEILTKEKINHNYIEKPNMFHIYSLFPIPEADNDVKLVVDLIKN